MTTFALRIRPSVQAELAASASADSHGDARAAFRHLERAHVLAQPSTADHVRVHWRMFRMALRSRLMGEAYGQAWRLLAAVVFTPLGLLPAGNTGGAGVSGVRPMPIPPDLQAIIEAARAGERPRKQSLLGRLAAALALSTLAALCMVGLSGCMSPPKDLDLALDKASAGGAYRVVLVPPAQVPAVNQMHSWRVRLSTSDGQPVQGAHFTVDGGMPQHGHGLPTQPRVTREIAAGVYQLDGMKFSMTGWWEVKLAIAAPPGSDKVTFNTIVDNPAVRP